jgi:hypothetical protein
MCEIGAKQAFARLSRNRVAGRMDVSDVPASRYPHNVFGG